MLNFVDVAFCSVPKYWTGAKRAHRDMQLLKKLISSSVRGRLK